MKRLITFIAICIIASILFASCRSNLLITKRRYNNGYYVTYNNGKKAVLTPKEEEKVVQTKTSKPSYYSQDKAEQNTMSGYSDQSLIADNNVIVASNEKMQRNAISQQYTKQPLKPKIKEDPAVQINRTLFKPKKMSSNSHEGDGLSLFWVVILVILILWAIGLLAGSIGGLINLLLVVALVLLILWLLRIV
jgi:hypothetical protein